MTGAFIQGEPLRGSPPPCGEGGRPEGPAGWGCLTWAQRQDRPMVHTRISHETRQKAQSLRKVLSKAERILWSHLRELKSEGMRFRKQAPIGRYIVDFAWLSGRVVVELDGDNHETDRQLRYDANRDAFLRERGFSVLRFSNWDAIDVPEWVVSKIKEVCRDHNRQPHPAGPLDRPPSPRGGGESRGST